MQTRKCHVNVDTKATRIFKRRKLFLLKEHPFSEGIVQTRKCHVNADTKATRIFKRRKLFLLKEHPFSEGKQQQFDKSWLP